MLDALCQISDGMLAFFFLSAGDWSRDKYLLLVVGNEEVPSDGSIEIILTRVLLRTTTTKNEVTKVNVLVSIWTERERGRERENIIHDITSLRNQKRKVSENH